MATIPLDDRDGFIWMDGKMVPWRDAKVHFVTHALHYGRGGFEGIRAYGGHSFKAREHNQRLLEGCKIMDMKAPYTLEEINKACEEVVKINKINDGYLRPLMWRGSEALGVTAQANKIHFAVATWEWPSYFSPE